MPTETKLSSPPSLPELRRNPEGGESIYIVYAPDSDERWMEYDSGAQKYAALGYEVLLVQHYSKIDVDGVEYRPTGNLPSSQFYTFKEDVTHQPDDAVFWDSAFEYVQKCRVCERDWRINENAWLRGRVIQCLYCATPS